MPAHLPRLIIAFASLCGCWQLPAATEDYVPPAGPPVEQVTLGDGQAVPLARWQPREEPCRVLLALHGFNDFHMAFSALAPKLAAGCTLVYAYDQRGFGDNPGRGSWAGVETLVADAVAMVRRLRQRHPDLPLFLLGESMGAGVVLLAHASGDLPPVAGTVLLAPAVWASHLQPWYLRTALWLWARLLPWLRVDRDWAGIRPSDDPQVLRYWGHHPQVIQRPRLRTLAGVNRLMDAALPASGELAGPALIAYGGRDEVIPPAAQCALLEHLPPAGEWRFAYYPEGYHLLTRDTRAGETRRDIAAWLQDPGAALPFGPELEYKQARRTLCSTQVTE